MFALSALVAASNFCRVAHAQGAEIHLNHLAGEKSPYLRQHATNPVDWYPWGEAAFARARREQKPIFLSIGYSTCHWCHVMERESFMDPVTAALLNERFVCIKVDREERPDVDRVYMAYVLASTGRGGWPMSVWLTPELKPFHGGMYFPPTRRGEIPAFKDVIGDVANRWALQREEVIAESDRALESLVRATHADASAGPLVANELWTQALRGAWRTFDQQRGGFGVAPKFPDAVRLGFLLDASVTAVDRKQRERAKEMAVGTLEAIVAGGIHDQLGGGFHRYSVDANWRVPHFEKMLNDQAQLASVCLSAWQVSGSSSLRAAAVDTLEYARARLMDPSGGFFSAEDADSATAGDSSAHREGAYYVWTTQQIESELAAEDAPLFAFVYGVTARGNADVDKTDELAGTNVLYRAHGLGEAAKKFGLTPAAAEAALMRSLAQLRQARERRPRPACDTKIITAWNGLMISSFARAAQILDEPRYAGIAKQAAAALRERVFNPASGRLSRSSRDGARDEVGFAEDYACLIQGLLDLYEASFEVEWLRWAVQLQEKQIELFADQNAGGFFSDSAEDKTVLLRLKEMNEGAEPAASSVSVRNLLRLSELLQRPEWRLLADRTAQAFHAVVERDPLAMPQMLAAMGLLEGSLQMALIHGERSAPSTQALVHELNAHFLPRRVLLQVDAQSREYFEARGDFVRGLPPEDASSATVYLCENYVCQLPTSDPAVLASRFAKDAESRESVRK